MSTDTAPPGFSHPLPNENIAENEEIATGLEEGELC